MVGKWISVVRLSLHTEDPLCCRSINLLCEESTESSKASCFFDVVTGISGSNTVHTPHYKVITWFPIFDRLEPGIVTCTLWTTQRSSFSLTHKIGLIAKFVFPYIYSFLLFLKYAMLVNVKSDVGWYKRIYMAASIMSFLLLIEYLVPFDISFR